MSTKERYGTYVWEALIKAQRYHEAGQCGMWHSAPLIGEIAGVSAMTARKYLEVLVSSGHAHRLNVGNSRYYMIAGGV